MDTHHGAMTSRVLHRHTAMRPPVAVRGEGPYIYDSTGKRYFDASGGAAVSCLGHGHPKVTAALKRQADALAYAHTSFFTNAPMEALAERLVAEAPAGLERVYFVSGGSEGVEAALKMARQYFVETGAPQRRHVIARRQSYHGNTLGALAAGGNAWRRKPFEPLLVEMSHIAPCYAYRGQRHDEDEAAYGRRIADELEAEILRLGGDTVAAFIAETVVGATLGAVPAAAGYFKRIREICDRYGVLLILDEVMCGMGRTGTLHACAQEGVAPDLLVIAKGLGGGYQPIGAVLLAARIYDAFANGSGLFQHGHTYIGHPIACAAALAVQEAIAEEDLLANARRQGENLRAALEERFGNHRHVGNIRGRGLFWGIELVADRASKRPFDPALRLHARIKQRALELGVLCYPMGGCADGAAGDHVMLAPPFIIESAMIPEFLAPIAQAIDEATHAAG
jgi:adenosylmethionine-8-amino-7-oxononanoate aminotransferase